MAKHYLYLASMHNKHQDCFQQVTNRECNHNMKMKKKTIISGHYLAGKIMQN